MVEPPEKNAGLIETAKKYLSKEEIQLGIGRLSVFGAGAFCTFKGIEESNLYKIAPGLAIGQWGLSRGLKYLRIGREKTRRRY